MDKVTIIIATFGDRKWFELGQQRALPSAINQDQSVTLCVHGTTLHEARNEGGFNADTEWLCFLDADDELAPGYTAAMLAGTKEIRAPLVSYVLDGQKQQPESFKDRNIERINPCVIGTLIRKKAFVDVGGFKNWRAWEDWALFLTIARRGARIEHIKDAVYIAYRSNDSRNTTVDDPNKLFKEIRKASW